MGNYIYITLILVLASLFFACSNNHHPVNGKLEEVERLMSHVPDSALAILKQITSPEKLPAGEYALWCLLFTQAQDKNYIIHVSDSLIRVACDYYKNRFGNGRLGWAYYYMGRVWQDLNDPLRAQDYYLKTLEVAGSSGDIPLKALSYNRLGVLCTYQDAYDLAIHYLEQAVDCYGQVADREGLSFVFRDIGRVYHQLDSIDAALGNYQQALAYDHPDSRFSVLSELGGVWAKKREYDQAFHCLYTALQLVTDTAEATPIYLTLGRIFREKGEKDSARVYLQKSMNSPYLFTRAASFYHLYHLSREEKDWPVYALMQEKYEKLNDTIQEITRTEQIKKTNALYHYQQAEKYRLSNMANQRNVYRLVLVVCLLSTGMAVLFFSFRKWKKQKEALIASLTKKMERLVQTREVKRKMLKNKFLSSGIYERLLLIMNSREPWSKIDQIQLEKWFDKEYPYLKREIGKRAPHLKDELRIFCYLCKAGITPSDIGLVYKSPPQTISKWRSQLYEELSGNPGSAKKLDELLESL